MDERKILTPVTTKTASWIQEQNTLHSRKFTKVLSAARLTRSVLAGLAEAGAPIGAQDRAEDIEKWVAHVFTHYAQTSA
jgi:hypothetical protein